MYNSAQPIDKEKKLKVAPRLSILRLGAGELSTWNYIFCTSLVPNECRRLTAAISLASIRNFSSPAGVASHLIRFLLSLGAVFVVVFIINNVTARILKFYSTASRIERRLCQSQYGSKSVAFPRICSAMCTSRTSPTCSREYC